MYRKVILPRLRYLLFLHSSFEYNNSIESKDPISRKAKAVGLFFFLVKGVYLFPLLIGSTKREIILTDLRTKIIIISAGFDLL
jgi:hypothetical protein